MKFEYKGYQLDLDVTLDQEGSIYWKAICNELNNFSFCFSPGLYRSLDGAISKFKQEIDRFLTNAENSSKEMKEDQEVQLVNQFILDLNQVVDEMEVVEKNDYYEVVLEAKLIKLMKSYSDSLCLGSSINVYRGHYNYVVKQREKEKEENKKLENIDTGISFEYKGTTTKVKKIDFDSGECFNCVDGTIVGSSILGLYEKFKNAVNGR